MKSSLQNPFADEWRECLLAYYRYILRRQEDKIEATLRELLLSVGIPAERLIALGAPIPGQAPAESARPDAPAPEQTSESGAQAPPAAPAAREKKLPKQLSFF
ncbi:MAG: hypothetical protein J7551_07650 [Chloroflexi bacterium]|nr:hypothetical protein [Chloroflexota bacterium]